MGWVAPVIMGISALASWLQNRKAAQAQKDQFNWARSGQGVSYDASNPLSHFLQDLYAQKDSNPTTTMDSTTMTDTAPYVTPGYTGIEDLLKSKIQARLNTNGLPAGTEEAMIRRTNDTFAGTNAALHNRLQSMGQGGAPSAGAAYATSEAARGRQLADLGPQMELMKHQLGAENIGLAQALINAFGKGERSTSKTHGTQTTTGGITPAMQLLAQIFGQDRAAASGVNPSSISVLGNTGMTTAQMLMFLYGSGAFGGGKPQASPGIH